MSDKFFSDKSKAKSRGLSKIGEKALAAADELLFKGEDGRWGYNVEQAEAIEAGDEIAKPVIKNGFANLLNQVAPAIPANATVTTHSSDGKKKVVENGVVKHDDKPAPAPQPRGASNKGYKIEKDRVRQNGVTRPSTGTLCGQVWAVLDSMPGVSSKDLQAIADEHNWNRNNVSCEFYNWRKFNGISGRSK